MPGSFSPSQQYDKAYDEARTRNLPWSGNPVPEQALSGFSSQISLISIFQHPFSTRQVYRPSIWHPCTGQQVVRQGY